MRPEISPELAEQFRRVCPIWAKHILDNPYDYDSPDSVFRTTDGKLWSLIQPRCCIVGEAYGRQSDYNDKGGCPTCMAYAAYLMDTQHERWPLILTNFLTHYEKEHAMEVIA